MAPGLNTNSNIGPVHIYIDNSNLWIEGQKTYARKNNLDVSFDPTWRFDVGRLKNILATKSHLIEEGYEPDIKINLYGSTPPPVDTVWQAIESQNVNVRTFARSSWSGREKQVDHEISLDAYDQAIQDAHSHCKSEFMIVSGDRDMMSSVSRIDRKGFMVHVWAWKASMTGAYERDEELRHVRVHHLDDYLEAIGFRQTTFRVDRNTIDPASIVVLDPLPHADEIESFVSTVRVPVYRYICAQQRPESSSQDLVIIPAFAHSMKPDEKTELFQLAERVLSQKGGVEIITYSMYIQRFLKSTQASKFVLKVSNRFQECPVQGETECDAAPTSILRVKETPVVSSDDNGANGWSEARDWTRKRRQQLDRKEELSRTRCFKGRYCQKGKECPRGHSKDEHGFFQIHGPLKPRKTKLCDNSHCLKGPNCHFAHGEEDLFCPTCEKKGHKAGDCVRRAKAQG